MSSKSGIYINFSPGPRGVPVSQKDSSVLDVALRERIPINHTCGGHGTCGTCLVQVLEGLQRLPPRSEQEAEMALDRGYQEDERLACQIEPVDGLTILIKNGARE